MDPKYQKLPNVRGAYQQIPDMGQSYPMQPNTPAAQSMASLPGSFYKQEVLSTPLKNRRKSFSWHLLSYVVSVLWLAPIASLLALNLTNHVIGASAWCPMGHCSADVFSENAFERARQLDRDDHNTLGALQFVAKALEVWFMLIATSLIYDVSMIIAKRGGGLPVGYFLTHLEFGDIRNLFNPLLYTSPIPHPNGNQPRRARTFKLYLFAILVVFLTILTNLMGPATAVLVLPTLQWVDTAHILGQRFDDTGAALPPGMSGDIELPGCDTNSLLAQNYSCTREVYGSTLDTCATSASETLMQAEQENGLQFLSVLQERAVQFTLNVSVASNTIWIPNRQALAGLSAQYIDFAAASMGLEENNSAFNNSLQTILNRQGPAIALRATCFVGNISEFRLDTDKDVICYSGWTNNAQDQYKKCFPYGSAWKTANNQSQFYLGSPSSANSSSDHTALITNYMTDRAIYYNEENDFGSGIHECLNRPDYENCDWDKIFSTQMTGNLRNSSTNVGIVEYNTPTRPTKDSRIWCDNIAYTAFPTYSLDTFPYSNPNNLIQVGNMTNPAEASTPTFVHPTWLLAAWSINNNETVDGDRPFAAEMSRVIDSMYGLSASTTEYTADQIFFMKLHLYSAGQAMSMINYYTNDPSSEFPEDPDHPIFRQWAARHVWAFSLSGRTAKLGVAVVVSGAMCVLLRIVLAIVGGAHDHSIVELFVAALEHIPRGEFLSHHKEKAMAKVRYEIIEDAYGKPQFKPERTGGYTPSGLGHAFPTPGAQYPSAFPSPSPGTAYSGHGSVHYDAGSYSSGSYGFGGAPSHR